MKNMFSVLISPLALSLSLSMLSLCLPPSLPLSLHAVSMSLSLPLRNASDVAQIHFLHFSRTFCSSRPRNEGEPPRFHLSSSDWLLRSRSGALIAR